MRIEAGVKIFIGIVWVCLAVCGVLLAWHGRHVWEGYKIRQEVERRKILANRILKGQELEDCLTQHCPDGGCKNLDDWKEAYDQVFGVDTACAVAIYKKNSLGLQGHVPRPRSDRCYGWRDAPDIYHQESISNNLAQKLLSRTHVPLTNASGRFLIPKKLNFIWITSQREFRKQSKAFYKVNKHIFHNTKATPQWQHTLWVSDLNFMPGDVIQQITAHNITIKAINELQVTSPMHLALLKLAMKYAQQEDWGRASDIARDLVEYYEGGVYVDGDYKLLDAPRLELYMQSYRSLFGANRLSGNIFEISNAFLASEPRGAVIGRKLEIVNRNLANRSQAPSYTHYYCDQLSAVVMQTGPISLSVAFLETHTQDDALMPYCSLFPFTHYPQCINKPKLGEHDNHGMWVREQSYVY